MSHRRRRRIGAQRTGRRARAGRAGWDVTVLEASRRRAAGTRTEQLTLPGVLHDVCSAIHPLAVASPAFPELDGSDGALPPTDSSGSIPTCHSPIRSTAAGQRSSTATSTRPPPGSDATARPIVACSVRSSKAGSQLTEALLSPLTIPPRHPVTLARYAVLGVRSATGVALGRFDTDEAKALFAGLSGHSMLPALPSGQRRLRPAARRARPHCRVADGTRRLATDRRRARGDARAGRRSDRVWPPGDVVQRSAGRRTPCCSTSRRGNCWPSPATPRPIGTGERSPASARPRRVQARLGARRPDPVEQPRLRPGGNRARRRHDRRDRRRRGGRARRASPRAAVRAARPADLVRSRSRPRRARTRRGPTATCRTGRRST